MGVRNIRIRTDADLDVAYRWKGDNDVPFPLDWLRFTLELDTPVTFDGALQAGGGDWWVVYETAAELAALDLVSGTVPYVVRAQRTVDGHVKALVEGVAIVVVA